MSLLDFILRRHPGQTRRLELETTTALAASAAAEKIDKATLGEEHAAPTLGGVRSIMTGNPSAGLDPVRLANILKAAEQGQTEAYLELAEEMEEKYLQYRACLRTRKQAVTGLDITVEAASDEKVHQDQAQLIRDFLNRDTLEAETFDILDALGKGFSVTELLWDTTKQPWMPRLVTRDPRWFEFDQVDGETLRLKGGQDGMAGLPQPLKPRKFIIHRSADKTGLTIRGGLARAACWAYLFQNMALKDWVIFAEIYGMPIRVGKYGPESTEADRRKLLMAVTHMATDAAAIIPASMQIEFVNGMAAGNPDTFRQLCDYLDQQVSKLVLGQTATTDATAGGLGGSQGNVHNDVREDIQRADAKGLAATFNRDLVRPMVDLNFGPPADGLYPRIKIGQAETFGPEEMDMIERFVAMGGEVEASVVQDKMGLPDPPEKRADGKPVRLLKSPGQSGPEITAQDGPVPPGASGGAKMALSASQTALDRPYGPLKNGASLDTGAPVADAIDGLVAAAEAEADSDWQEIKAPFIDPIEQALSAATSFEDMKARLLALPDAVRVDAMAELLARATFTARLAGEAGLKIDEGGG